MTNVRLVLRCELLLLLTLLVLLKFLGGQKNIHHLAVRLNDLSVGLSVFGKENWIAFTPSSSPSLSPEIVGR